MPADLTTVLGRLLSDPSLRAAWRRDPEATARRLDAEPETAAALDAVDLEHQAETLVEKRFHEVSRLLPRTLAILGGGAAAAFREHAAGFWPEGHRRHAEDASAFGRMLEQRRLPHSPSELHRLRFMLAGRRFSAAFVPDAWVGGRPRRALQVLYRRRGALRSFALYFGL
jgi:hypothetical protein